jgi:hypothetical protein
MVPLGRLEQYQNGMASIEKRHWTLFLRSDETPTARSATAKVQTQEDKNETATANGRSSDKQN